jgi:hypothetical protein
VIPQFETNRSDWNIRVTVREVLEVLVATQSLNLKPGFNQNVWVTKTDNCKRLWIIRDRMMVTWVTADAEPDDPSFALPIPHIFFELLLELMSDGGGADIFCNEVEGTIVARSDSGRYLSIDHPENVKFSSKDLPYPGSSSEQEDGLAVAEVSMTDMAQFASFVLANPGGVDWSEVTVYPFASIVLDDNQFAWTMDWRRSGAQRITGSVPAHTQGTISTSFFPYPVANVVRVKDKDSSVKIFVAGKDAEYAYFVGDNWGARMPLYPEHLARWHVKLVRNLKKAGMVAADHDSEQLPSFIEFAMGDTDCYASIHAMHDDTETVRLTYIVADGVPETLNVYSEINRMNEVLIGSRLSLREDEVRLVVEFPAEGVDNVKQHLETFQKAVAACKGIDTFLPLFAE